MNVYDSAHQLARVLKQSTEYTEYKNLEKKLKENPSAKEMLDDFRKRQFEVQSAQMMGQKVDEEKVKKLQELQKILMQDPAITEFLHAEYRLTQILADIYKILGDALELDTGVFGK